MDTYGNIKINLEELKKEIDEGNIEVNKHPNLELYIYNYTRKCAFEQHWTELCLNCRGLILDKEGNIVARGFRKFFNMEEIPSVLIPNESFEVFEKMDGSLGIIFYYNNEWHIATRGSFVSEQAIKGKEIFNKQEEKYGSNLSIYNTYLCEIIYPENRIVCGYGNEEKLVLLGVITNTGYELPYDQCIFEWHSPELIVKKYHGITDYKTLKALVKNDAEGFVIRFKNGFRMKIKGEEYVRLHRLLTNFSNVDIWEVLKRGEDISKMLDKVPDEFDAWVRKIIKQLTDRFIFEKAKHEKEFWTLIDRKQFAEMVKDRPDKHFMFRRLSSHSKIYDEMIWESIRPTYQKPFWNKEDEE